MAHSWEDNYNALKKYEEKYHTKAHFPDWLYIPPNAYKTVDGKMLDDKD